MDTCNKMYVVRGGHHKRQKTYHMLSNLVEVTCIISQAFEKMYLNCS